MAEAAFSIFCFSAEAQHIRKANELFRAGDFEKAAAEYTLVVERNPQNLRALTYLGYVALLSNKLEDAAVFLGKANEINPKQTAVLQLLAHLHYRKNDFDNASFYYRAIGRTTMADKLKNFNGQLPYQIDSTFHEATIKFIVTDPLPFVRVKINENYEGNFIIDTGAGELTLDTDFAREAGADVFGPESGGQFGGGKKAMTLHGRIRSIDLGDLTVKNVPVTVLSLRQIEMEGMKIDGVIGTTFLSQFLSSIDYKNGQLVLRPRNSFRSERIFSETSTYHHVPFYLADDHFMLSHGSIGGKNMLFFVDTGLANTAFTCPKSTLRKLNIRIDKRKKDSGQGGGGTTHEIYPFDLDEICLGECCVKDLHGLYGTFPAIEKVFGMTIHGLLSHEFFKNKELTIDFESMRYLISK